MSKKTFVTRDKFPAEVEQAALEGEAAIQKSAGATRCWIEYEDSCVVLCCEWEEDG